MHLFLFGILLGMGAAIPIGPVNLEIIRRNLRFGTSYGVMTGLGACMADLTYLILLSLGALTLLQYPEVLRALGIVGSLVLAWFGINAFCSKLTDIPEQDKPPSLFRYSIDGYLITLINPYTILFWASISSQLSVMTAAHEHALFQAGSGVIIGAVAWIFTLNGFLHFTRHRLSKKFIHRLNYVGGVILLGFAGIGLVHAIGF
jgi:L-lysine exporter family protein LysE/ArgO